MTTTRDAPMADDLAARLRAHAAWLANQGADGTRLDLADAPPGARDLRDADLRGAELAGADLTKAGQGR